MTQQANSSRSPSVGAVQQHLDSLFHEGQQLRTRALEVTDQLQTAAQEDALPAESGALAVSRERLHRDEYRVLVVGEIKRGKSTFVNALTGRPFLPTDVEVATSQVFRIGHSERESFRIRFEDGTSREIGDAREIPRYGSQIAADAGEAPTLDQIIRWIEIDLPFELLPRNISFFDTPGVGGLKAIHGEITHRLLPEADGIIFVLDSEKPVEDSELQFLEAVLKQTPHVFFVQTKVDRLEGSWAEIRDKSQKHLREKFGDTLPSPTIWPFSSTKFEKACKLLKEGETRTVDADRALKESRFPELFPALMTFLYRVVGWSRAANVALFAGRYHQIGRKMLIERAESLRDQSWREELRARYAEKRRWFGETNAEFVQLKNQLFDSLREGTSDAGYRMQSGLTRIENYLRNEIDKVNDIQMARDLAEDLDEEVLRNAADLWQKIRTAMMDCLTDSLAGFLDVADSEVQIFDHQQPVINSPSLRIEGDLLRRLQTAGGAATGMGMALGGVPTTALLMAGLLTPPLAALGALIGGIATLIGAGVGWNSSGRAEVDATKPKLLSRLQMVMSTVRPHYGRAVDQLTRGIERSLRSQIDATAERKRKEVEAELGRLEEEERMTAQERTARLKEIEKQFGDWTAIGKDVEALRTDLVHLHDRLLVSSKAG